MSSDNTPKPFTYTKHDNYQQILQDFDYGMILLDHVISDFPTIYEPFQKDVVNRMAGAMGKFSKEEKKEFDDFMTFLKDTMAKEKRISGTISVSKKIGEFANQYMIREGLISDKVIPFLMEVSIVYLITTFEDFLKKILIQTMKTNLNILKSGKTITHEEIIECKSLEEIHSKMMDKEINDLLRLDIESIAENIKEKYKFDFTTITNWNKFLEIYYRRHAIVHNNGIPDEKYRFKTQTAVVDRLVVDKTYVSEAIVIFKKFTAEITKFLSEKYPVRA